MDDKDDKHKFSGLSNLTSYEGDIPQAQPRQAAQAHGHPETGLPAKKKNSGCAPVILLCIGIGGLGV